MLSLLTRRAFLIGACSSCFARPGWAGETRRFAIAVKNGKVANAWRTIRVDEGDMVDIEFTTDRRLRLHLHGIDIETEVVPDVSARISFAATVAGRFPITVHGEHGGHGHGALMYVEVHPR